MAATLPVTPTITRLLDELANSEVAMLTFELSAQYCKVKGQQNNEWALFRMPAKFELLGMDLERVASDRDNEPLDGCGETSWLQGKSQMLDEVTPTHALSLKRF